MIDDTLPINHRVINQRVLSNNIWTGKLTYGQYCRRFFRPVIMQTTNVSKPHHYLDQMHKQSMKVFTRLAHENLLAYYMCYEDLDKVTLHFIGEYYEGVTLSQYLQYKR
jgi:hypothetical protein